MAGFKLYRQAFIFFAGFASNTLVLPLRALRGRKREGGFLLGALI